MSKEEKEIEKLKKKIKDQKVYITTLNKDYLDKKKKTELKKAKEENELWKLRNTNLLLQQEILKTSLKYNNMGFNKGDFIYIEYMKYDATMPFSNLGFIIKETANHLKYIVYDKKRESAHKYSVHKDYIRGIKHYDGDGVSSISFDELLKLWESNNKLIKRK